MKFEQKKEFQPVVITLETQEEVSELRLALRSSSSSHVSIMELHDDLSKVSL